jgi:AraC family transcriptional regulator, alkane utilization regulator
MDALSDVLKVLRLSGAIFLDAEFTAPWCVTSSSHLPTSSAVGGGEHIVFFHWLIAGRCKARLKSGGETFEVGAGDLLLMPNDDVHFMGSDLSVGAIDAASLIKPTPEKPLLRIEHGGGGDTTRFVCGFLACDKRICRPVLESLPGMLRVPFGDDPTAAWFRSLLQVGTAETTAQRPGSESLLTKLSELLFIEAIRRYGETLPQDQTGWLAGLRDRYVGKALTLMHQRPDKAWTVDGLATAVGLSRSALAQRFTELLGQPPMQYLTRWRLTVAAQRLRNNEVGLATIAEQVGYESEAAFNRAFKREFSMPPATWVRSQDSGTPRES